MQCLDSQELQSVPVQGSREPIAYRITSRTRYPVFPLSWEVSMGWGFLLGWMEYAGFGGFGSCRHRLTSPWQVSECIGYGE